MRYAICNETFGDWDHTRVCRFVAQCGYTGLELAPFTFANHVSDISSAQRQAIRKDAEDNGLTVIGLHWLLAKTQGLQLNSADPQVREKTANYLVELANCCRDVGGSILVFGSPAQRRVPEGASMEQATEYCVDTLKLAKQGIVDAGVTFCLEPLSPPEADFINTCAEAVAILDQIDHPRFLLHLDVKAMSTDEAATPDLISRHAARTGHFHANDPDLRGPGFGDTDFVPIFQALKDSNYDGWVSVEVFDYSPDPETIAVDSLRYMRECEGQLA